METLHYLLCDEIADPSAYKSAIEQMLGIEPYTLDTSTNSDDNSDDIDPDDLVTLFIKESRHYTRLTPEQSIELTQMLIEARTRKQTIEEELNTPTNQQNSDLVQALEVADALNTAIKQIFCERNGGLIVSMAARYRFSEVPLTDLIGMATEGMYRALEDYDGSYQFSTYATLWMRSSIQKSLPEYDPYLVTGRRFHELRLLVREAENIFYQEHHRHPSVQELAEEAALLEWENLPVAKRGLRQIEDYKTERSKTLIEYILVMNIPATIKIVGEPSYGGDQTSLIDNADVYEPAANDLSPEEILLSKMLIEDMEKVLNSLTAREMRILQLRFGLFGREPLSAPDIAKSFGLGKRRIQQIMEKALERINSKYPHFSELLVA